MSDLWLIRSERSVDIRYLARIVSSIVFDCPEIKTSAVVHLNFCLLASDEML